MILPNSFLLGSAKCGTTTLTHWLSHNPEVCIAKNKEPLYFNTNQYANGDRWYSDNHFDHHNGQKIVMDNTTMHLMIPFVAPRIKKSCGHLNPKFIVLAREPVERAYSHWWMQHTIYSPGYAREDFGKALRHNFESFSYEKFKYEHDRMLAFDGRYDSYVPTYIEQGLYAHHIQRYIKLFGRENVLILFTMDMVDKKSEVYNDAISFLGGSTEYRPLFINKKQAKSEYKERNDLISLCSNYIEAKKIAQSYFLRDVIALSELTKRDLVAEWGYDKL